MGLGTEVHDSTIQLVLEKGKTIEFIGPADITCETTDAIVNAANSSLLGGGGVDGAIHRAGGPAILAECKEIVSKIGSLPAGKAAITTGGRLAAKHVIHTVGPVYYGGDQGEAEKLASCHRESIRLADEQGLESLSFPAISTGAFGYPVPQAAAVAISSTVGALTSANHVNKVRFVLFDVGTFRAYARAAEEFLRSNSVSTSRIEKARS
ncbi:MAG: Appr-p processing enzyme family [Candidatus Sulfotelmatobacter sp.]|nr:Appr-p processing enzyme family [Candidatus Sulfotelmatobacter sp.]